MLFRSSGNLKPKDVTISMWLYLPSMPSISSAIFSSYNNASGEFDQIDTVEAGPQGFSCYSGTQWESGIFNMGSTALNKWQQITCVYNGTAGTMTLYIDGKKISSISSPYHGDIYVAGGYLTDVGIGYSNEGNPLPNGYIDDVMIFSSALASGDIEKVYAAGLPEHILANR